MKKILIIEDDPIVSHIYRSRLEKEGFEVDVSADGQAGYYRLYEFKPDALLLDLMLPKLNGIDLLKKIRAVREFEKMPVIVFTNAYVANMINEALTGGASAVYNKSTVTPRQIIDAVNSLLCPHPQVTMPAEAVTAQAAQTPAAAAPAAPASEARPHQLNNSDDTDFRKELLKSFEQSGPSSVNEMRKLLQEISKAGDAQRTQFFEQLYRKVRSFSSNAGLAGVGYIAKMGAALEALMKEMVDKPKTVTPSTLRTAATAIDFFSELSKPGLPHDLADNPPIDILIVDDEMLSRRAIVYALEKAFLKATAVEDGEAALAKAHLAKFDLVFLDINMPGMDGFQLCDKLRQSGKNKTTPIIFVTSTADFQMRAQTTLRGGSDLIAKPFMFIELTVKALTFALRHRIEVQKVNRGIPPARPSAPAPTAPANAELIM
ncbi:MAG TPA: response regulator [Methylomirabilota bacterium]|nr:response regulator [Methylomirabilota bacterium]